MGKNHDLVTNVYNKFFVDMLKESIQDWEVDKSTLWGLLLPGIIGSLASIKKRVILSSSS
jgi:hypothetical protein